MDHVTKQGQVSFLNVSTVFAQMNDQTVGPSEIREHGRGNRVRFMAASRLPQGGHVVNIDAESSHIFPFRVEPGKVKDNGIESINYGKTGKESQLNPIGALCPRPSWGIMTNEQIAKIGIQHGETRLFVQRS